MEHRYISIYIYYSILYILLYILHGKWNIYILLYIKYTLHILYNIM